MKNRAQKPQINESVKLYNIFGYQVNEIERSVIESRKLEYLKGISENLLSYALGQVHPVSKKEAHLEMGAMEFVEILESGFKHFERWLADETWRRPNKRLTPINVKPVKSPPPPPPPSTPLITFLMRGKI